jgi:hypothetical protein
VANSPWSVLDARATEISRAVEVFGYALDGLLEMHLRTHATQRGVRRFHAVSEDLSEHALERVTAIFKDALSELLDASGVRSDIQSDVTSEAIRDAAVAFETFFSQIRLLYTRRFRDIVISHGLARKGDSVNPNVLTRSGRKIDAETWALLTSRKALLDGYNSARIRSLVETGYTAFHVVQRSVEHEDDGKKVLIADYPEVSDTMFHPRSSALVGEGAHAYS